MHADWHFGQNLENLKKIFNEVQVRTLFVLGISKDRRKMSSWVSTHKREIISKEPNNNVKVLALY